MVIRIEFKSASAIVLIIVPVTFVSPTVIIVDSSLTLSDPVAKVSFVNIAILVNQSSDSMVESILETTFILV